MADDVIFTQFARPDDPDLDVFRSGNGEVDDFFRSRAWFNDARGKAAPPTYQFCTKEGGDVVGYAAVSFRNCAHPDDASSSKAKYLVIYAAGLHQRFQGVRNPRAPAEGFAVSMFRVLEQFDTEKAGCVGLYLWVREDNARAIGFYRRFGFTDDPGGAVHRDDKVPHLTMRKLL